MQLAAFMQERYFCTYYDAVKAMLPAGIWLKGDAVCSLVNPADKERNYAAAGEEFNINSPKQLGEVLFEKMKLPFAKKTKTGYSTNVDVLEKLKVYSPIVEDVLEYRQVMKLKSTYVTGLLEAKDENDRLHTNFKQSLTATGRLSSTEPNLQNIPILSRIVNSMEFRSNNSSR